MSLKLVDNKVVEKMDVTKTFGELRLLEVEPVKVWEDYVDENGEEKRRETDVIEAYDVRLFSTVAGDEFIVTVPADATAATLTSEANYDDQVVLVDPTARFWSNTEIINNRRVVTTGVKVRATDVLLQEKNNQSANQPPKDGVKKDEANHQKPKG